MIYPINFFTFNSLLAWISNNACINLLLFDAPEKNMNQTILVGKLLRCVQANVFLFLVRQNKG